MRRENTWWQGRRFLRTGISGCIVPCAPGFLARLAPNGNLLHTLKIGDDQECTLLDFQSRDGVIYLLGSMRSIDGGLLREEVWIARLAEEGAQAD